MTKDEAVKHLDGMVRQEEQFVEMQREQLELTERRLATFMAIRTLLVETTPAGAP